MSENGAEAVVLELLNAMNSGDLDRVAAVAAEDIAFVDVAGGEEIAGRGQWREYSGRYVKAFPDLQLDVANIVSTEDTVTLELVLRGTHKGPLESPAGSIPATGRPIDVRACIVARVRDGLITDAREYYDAVTLMLQLGIMPDPVVPAEQPA